MNGVYLVQRFSFVITNFFIKGNFIIGGVECTTGREWTKTSANTLHLHKREKEKRQMYPLWTMEIPDQPYHKIVIDLVTYLNVSTSGNQHILAIMTI